MRTARLCGLLLLAASCRTAKPAATVSNHDSTTPIVNDRYKAGGDLDGDGLADADDQCPADPEDKDDFADGDGCPESDNDGDTIPDVDDKCPNDHEDIDYVDDTDGCPEP